jgi:hypothetical protein
VKVRQTFTPVWCLQRSEGMCVSVKNGAKDNSPFLFPSLYRKRGKKADSKKQIVFRLQRMVVPLSFRKERARVSWIVREIFIPICALREILILNNNQQRTANASR